MKMVMVVMMMMAMMQVGLNDISGFDYTYDAVYDNDEEDDELCGEDDSKERAQEAGQCDRGYYFDCDRHGYDTAQGRLSEGTSHHPC